jgi:filamentous hemagglutinin family protein
MADAVRFPNLVPPLLATLLATAPAHAQIVTDGTLGPKVSLSGSTVDIGAQLGTQRGDNLFHSFEKFGIATGQTATFTGPDTVKNVISRVTGGEISTIDGTLASRVGQADLYFLNPAGVVFGPNVRLDVPGSFHVSTAHEMRFADGARFSALDKTGSGLTVAAPEAFGFLGRPPGRISVDQSALEVKPGKVLSLVGSDVDIVGGPTESLKAPNGAARISAITSAGSFNALDGTTRATSFGEVRLAGGARIDVSGNGAGNIKIRSGKLTVDDAALMANNTGENDAGTGIDIQTTFFDARNGLIGSEAWGTGKGAPISIHAGTMFLQEGSSVASSGNDQGGAGGISVTAGDLSIIGTGTTFSTLLESNLSATATGTADPIEVVSERLTIRDGGAIRSRASGARDAAAVHLTVGNLFMSGDVARGARSRIVSESLPEATGSTGPVTVSATEALSLQNIGQIASRTEGSGSAGQVTVHADTLSISGGSADVFTGIVSQAAEGATGKAGAVKISARRIDLQGTFAQISSNTLGGAAAGNVEVEAGQLSIKGDKGVSGTVTGVTSDALEGSTAGGGNVSVKAHDIDIRDSGEIGSRTFARGDAGTVTIQADRLLIQGGGGEFRTGISSSVEPGAGGKGGSMSVQVAGDLELRNGAAITSQTSGGGNAGAVKVTAGRLLVFGNGDIWSQISSQSFPDASGTGGAGGSIDIHADTVILSNSGYIITQSNTPKRAGDITIEAHDSLEINNPVPFVRTVDDDGTPFIENTSGVFSSAVFGTRAGDIQISAGDRLTLNNGYITSLATRGEGGRITVKAGRLIDAHDSVFESSVLGSQLGSDAGDISIDSTLLILDNSHIKANAVGGNGGNVRIIADTIIQSPGSSIEATSERAISGTISITAPNVDVAGSLLVLPETFFDASSQLREACANQGGRPTSSLVVGGQGGLPPDPAGPLSASLSGLSSAHRADQVPNHAATLLLGLSPEASSMAGMPYPVLGAPRTPCRG